MAAIKKYAFETLEELGEVFLEDSFVEYEANEQLVKDYLVALRNNRRQYSASTKTRAEVAHTTKKPHPQKGTGRARQGSLVAPQFRGGGVVFGPKPKDIRGKRNRKEKRLAIRSLLAEKIREKKVVVVDSLAFSQPKTALVTRFINEIEVGKRPLFLLGGEGEEDRDANLSFRKSARNCPKVDCCSLSAVNGYDIVRSTALILEERGLTFLLQWLTSQRQDESIS